MEVERYVGLDQRFDPRFIEQVILELGDAFNVRVSWDKGTIVLAGVAAIAGGVIGHYAGGRVGAAIGASIGSVTGVGISMVSLREIWDVIKVHLPELLYIVFNRLRQIGPFDIIHAYNIMMASQHDRKELIITIVEFMATTLGRKVISSLL